MCENRDAAMSKTERLVIGMERLIMALEVHSRALLENSKLAATFGSIPTQQSGQSYDIMFNEYDEIEEILEGMASAEKPRTSKFSGKFDGNVKMSDADQRTQEQAAIEANVDWPRAQERLDNFAACMERNRAAKTAPPIITGPGEYKTRGGDKVEVSGQVRGEWIGSFSKFSNIVSWAEDGAYCFGGFKNHDIIGPWEEPEGARFNVGDYVCKPKGYAFPGIIKSKFQTEAGKTRFVVECTAPDCIGMLHIYSSENLKLTKGEG